MTENSESRQQGGKGSSAPLRVALLGAGLFATNSHAPVLLNHKESFTTVAVWSRSKESAEKLAKKFNCDAFGGDEDLESLIATSNSDIEAFIVALPLDVQPILIPRLLRAGKHVLSEKPIAPTVAHAKELLEMYTSMAYNSREQPPPSSKSLIWSVAENFRYEPGIQKAANLVQSSNSIIGEILFVNVVVKNPFRPDNPYLNTAWRKHPSWYGGFFVDAFVHAAAGIRTLIPGPIQQVSAVTSHHAKQQLPGPDTLNAHMTWKSGVQGTIAASYACDTFKYEFEITGREGTLLLQRSTTQPGYNLIVTKGTGKDAKVITDTFFKFEGLAREFLAFGSACRDHDRSHDMNTPQQALEDLKLVEALLESGKQGGSIISL